MFLIPLNTSSCWPLICIEKLNAFGRKSRWKNRTINLHYVSAKVSGTGVHQPIRGRGRGRCSKKAIDLQLFTFLM